MAERIVDQERVAAGSFGAAALEQPIAESTAPTAIIARSMYDDAMGVVARRHELNARLVRENEQLVKALRTAAAWIFGFLETRSLSPYKVDVTWSMTREGVIILHIERKET